MTRRGARGRRRGRRSLPLLLSAATLVAAGCTPGPDDPTAPSTDPPAAATATAPGVTAGPLPVGPSPAVPILPPPASSTSRLRIGLDRDPSSLDPAAVTDAAGRLVVDAVFDSLTRMSPDLRFVRPAAAASWEVSSDGLEWTFRLRDATWHDGLPVNARQFERAFSHVAAGAADGRPFNAGLLRMVEGWEATARSGAPLSGVRAVDDDTLTVRLRHPMADLPALLSHPALAPRRRGAMDPLRPVGNGPFELSEDWAHNQFVRVTAFEGHHAEPRLGEVVFVVYAQAGSRLLQYEDFRSGVLDVASVPAPQLDQARAQFGSAADGVTGPGVLDGLADEGYWVGFNAQRPPFDDRSTRLAVAQLLDRDALLRTLTSDSRTRSTSLVPPSVPGGGQVECEPCAHDPLEARSVLADLSLPDAEPIRILTIEGTTDAEIAIELADELRDAADVRVVVESLPTQEWLARMRESDLQVFRGGWEATWPTMGGFLEPLFHSRHLGGTNLVRVDDADLDALIDTAMARGTAGSPAAVAAWQDVEREVLDRALVAPLFWYQHNRVVSDEVIGFTLDATGAVDLTRVDVQRG